MQPDPMPVIAASISAEVNGTKSRLGALPVVETEHTYSSC